MTEHTRATMPPRLTLDQIATAAAAIIADARAAGLAEPYSVNAHDYGPPTASLYISERQDRDIWEALQQWADYYGSEVSASPGHTPGSVYASVDFRRDSIRYEVTAVIHQTPGSDDQPEQPAAA
jgi:hypothetical protein